MRPPLLRSQPDAVDRIEIETPCTVPWDSMHGGDQVRHCGECRQNVYNVAELSRADALRLITGRERVCLRIYRRPDGTVVTADCWSRLRAARRRGVWAFFAMLVVIGWAELTAMFVGLAGLRRVTREPAMGEMRGAAVMPKPDAGQARLPSVPPPPGITVTAGVPPLRRVFPPDEALGKRRKSLHKTMGRVGHPIDTSDID